MPPTSASLSGVDFPSAQASVIVGIQGVNPEVELWDSPCPTQALVLGSFPPISCALQFP